MSIIRPPGSACWGTCQQQWWQQAWRVHPQALVRGAQMTAVVTGRPLGPQKTHAGTGRVGSRSGGPVLRPLKMHTDCVRCFWSIPSPVAHVCRHEPIGWGSPQASRRHAWELLEVGGVRSTPSSQAMHTGTSKNGIKRSGLFLHPHDSLSGRRWW